MKRWIDAFNEAVFPPGLHTLHLRAGRKRMRRRGLHHPTDGFPSLSAILVPDGSAIARCFDTAEEASAHNTQMAKGLEGGGVKHRSGVCSVRGTNLRMAG